MSTLLHDLEAQADCAVAYPPAVLDSSETGPAVDLRGGDGPVFAVLLTGGLDPGTTVAVGFDESSDLSVWTAVPAAAIPATAAAEAVACVSFARAKRYVRCQVTLAGPTPGAAVAVLVGQQRKVL